MRGHALVAAFLLALAAAACSSQAEQAPPPPPEVTVAAPLVREVLDWDEFTGRFEAPQTVEVRARVGGYIQAVHFRDGDYVRQGQLLFTLDPRAANTALAAASSRRAQAEAQLNLARTELARAEALLERGFLSQAALDMRQAEVRTAEAAMQAAEAAVRAARLELEYTRVTAPISGRVSDRRADPGNLVAGGSSAADVLTVIVSTSPIHFAFDASEAILLRYQRSGRNGPAPIQVRLQDETGFTHAGVLDFTDNALNAGSGVVRLRAVIQNPDGFLRPGMFGQARLAGAAPYQALLVPDAAVVTDQARRVVYVVQPDGTTAARPVELGPLAEGLRVVRAGLDPADRVVIAGVQRIQQPGMPVTPVEGRIEPAAAPPQAPGVQPAPAAAASFSGAAG